jgi:chromosomal replication initiator protein
MDSMDSYAQNSWEKACKLLKKQVCPATFEQWFHGIVPISVDNNIMHLGVSDEFFAGWLEDHYRDLIIDALSQVTGSKLGLSFEIGHEAPAHIPTLDSEPVEDEPKITPRVAETQTKPSRPSSISSRYTFDNFAVGEENRYAYTASITAANSLGTYNPLYIYGGTGLGKTHLLHAVGHQVIQKNPSAIVEFVTCENFLNSYVESIQSKKHSDFRNRFRSADVLLIDDVHQLGNKTQLQEEFFNTFNNLYYKNKQIILTSDKPPSEIKGLEERLVSRFESGVSTEITTPSLETRLAILKMKQVDHLIKLKDEVLMFLASRISTNIRRLEGALIQLIAYSSAMTNCEVTIELAEKLLGNILKEENVPKKAVTILEIQKRVAEYFDIRVSDILGNKRPKSIAEPRMIAMYLSRELTDFSYPEIAESFGGRNHATIIHAFKKMETSVKSDDNLKQNINVLKHKIQN